MAEKKVVQPRLQTPVPGTTTTFALPDEMLSEQVKRLALLGAVGGALWTVGLVLNGFIIPTLFNRPYPWPAIAISVFSILISAALVVHMKYSQHCAQVKTDVGLGYLVFSSFAIAMLNTWSVDAMNESLGHLSWITIAILVSAMIMVTTPRKVLIASLIAASMDPLAVWIAHLRGFPVPTPLATFIMFVPNYSCALVAVLPSRVLRRLGRRLNEAREMGSYRLVELLGYGGMGEVWRAEHRLLARSAAIKLVRPEVLGASSEADVKLALRRFEREAQATAALSSPHTIRLFDFGATGDGAFYYVMELLQGRDLESLVRDFGPLPAERVVYLLRQVCHSLADAHARGLVHRDIKPANIYACRMGLEYDFIKVLDFGLVKFREGVAQTLLTGEHPTSGTPAYMAPEIILGGTDVDRRADVYALGCVAYFLLTGHLVFEADSAIKMLVQHVQSEPIPPSARAEVPIPRDLEDLIMRCLEKDPAKRPQDAKDLYRLACGCHGECEKWNQQSAQTWWEQNLPELTGPLTLSEPKSDLVHKAVAIS